MPPLEIANGKRMALVIGNSDYKDGNKVSGIENANGMRDCLKGLEFEVETLPDADLSTMGPAIDAFGEKIRDPKVKVVLFFYSGHGVQLEEQNYLIPTDGALSPDRAVPLARVLTALSKARSETIKLVFLDACRDNPDLPEGAPKGMTTTVTTPPKTLMAFAASPNQVAESGRRNERSVYTKSLLKYIPEPGLDLGTLFTNVGAEVFRFSNTGQRPIETGMAEIPKNFYFRPPVEIQLKTFGWPYNRLLVFRNGELVLPKENQAQSPEEPLELDIPLRARGNELVLMVSHGKEYHNGQVWGRTQSWSYKLDLRIPVKDVPEGRTITLEGQEDAPFKDGPHHGQTFIVAKATLFVDPVTADVTLPKLDNDLPNPDTGVAFRQSPFWAQDQEILFQAKLADFKLPPDEILGGVIDGKLFPLIRPFLARLLTTGKIFDTLIADPEKVYVVVRGNGALRPVAEHCMTALRQNRIRDLRASFAAFFNDRAGRPFDVYVDGLNADIRANAANFGSTRLPEELRVWTSLDDLSAQAPAAAELTQAPAATAHQGFFEARRLSLAQAEQSILQPQPDEALVDSRIVEQTVEGVPLKAQVYTFLTVKPEDDQIRLHARVIADLSDLQKKIGPLIDTIPLPTDNCSRFALDNIVARIWGKELTVEANTATLKLNGNVEVWTCVRNPFGGSPWKNRNLSQSFEAKLPFGVEVVSPQSYALKLGDPSVDLGGALGGVTEGILKIAGVNVNEKVKEALDRAIHPNTLKQKLPEFVLKYNPTLTRAELLSDSGALALRLEVDTTLNVMQLAELIQDLISGR